MEHFEEYFYQKRTNFQHISHTKTNMSNSSPSICIPRVFAEITRRQIKDAFVKVLNDDCIERIDMIRNLSCFQQYIMYICTSSWDFPTIARNGYVIDICFDTDQLVRSETTRYKIYDRVLFLPGVQRLLIQLRYGIFSINVDGIQYCFIHLIST